MTTENGEKIEQNNSDNRLINQPENDNEEQGPKTDETSKGIRNCCNCFINWLQHFTVELTVLLVFLCNALTDAQSTELIIQNTCLNTFRYPTDNCTHMNDNIKNRVQSYASNVIMAKSLIEALFPAVLSLFIGPWMDLNGRKPFLIMPLIGMTITYAIWLGLSYVDNLSSNFFIIPCIPFSICGGMIAVQASAYSYLADTVTVELRAIKMAILALFMGLGVMLGYLISNAYNNKFKANLSLAIYGTAIGLSVFNAIYTTFRLPETIKNDEENESSIITKFTSFFNLNHIKESMRVLFAKRPGHARVIILLLIPVIALSVIIEQGEGSFLLLVTKKAFSWTSDDYNNFKSRMVLIAIFIGAPGLWILKRYVRVTDLTFLFIVMILQLISSLMISLANKEMILYIGRGIGSFIDLIKAVAKTKISFLVLSIEIGKIFSIISSLEAIAPLIATPIYGALYNVVLSKKPVYLFFLSVALSGLILILLTIIKIIQWKYGIKEIRRR